MKKIILLICLLGAFFTVSAANWYHFRSVSPSGHNLCYRIKSNSTVEVAHSDSVTGYHPYTTYNNSSYRNDLIGEVIIPDTVSYNNKVYIVTCIGDRAFWRCHKMTSVTLPSSVERIEGGAFDSCLALSSLTIPRNVKYIGGGIVVRCNNLDTINYLADSCVADVFIYPNINARVIIGNNVKYIPKGLFYTSLVDTIILPSSVKYIAKDAFNNCKFLAFISLPTSVVSIGNQAFAGCSNLTSISLPPLIDSIGIKTFFNCSNLTSIIIPENVTKIGDYAFARCINLVSLTSLNPIPPQVCGDSTFHKVYKGIPLNVPSQSINTYKLAYGWRDFINIVPDTNIGTYEVNISSNDTNMGYVKIILPYTPQNNQMVIQAIAFNNYRFTHWSDGNQEEVRSLLINKDTNLIAYFEREDSKYTLNVATDNPSMGSVSGGGMYNANSQVSISANPYQGYEFVFWQDGNTQANRTITLVSDSTFTAYFRAKSSSDSSNILVVSIDAAMGSVYGGGTYKNGSTTTIMAVPKSGYMFVQWQDGNTQDTRTITVVSDSTFTAYFRPTTAISETSEDNLLIYSANQNIVVKGAENEPIRIYDIYGRMLHHIKNADAEYRVNISSSGIYLVQVGNRKAVKVAIVK